MTAMPIGPREHELDTATQLYRRHLEPAGLFEFDIGSLDRLGQSVVLAALRTEEGFGNDGFGYGASVAEARVGALGEMSETYHVYRALTDSPACEALSYSAMVLQFGVDAVIDPLELCLPAGSPYSPSLPLRWVELQTWPSGVPVWAPRECVATGGFDYACESSQVVARGSGTSVRLFRPITCGLGAGVSLAQALSHGVLELLQRDGNCTRFRAMDRGIDLILDHIEDPGIRELLENLEEQGLGIRVKLASTEFDLVNLYVVGEPTDSVSTGDDFPLTVTACGEAVHSSRERALRKALLEYTAARVRKSFMHGPLEPIRRLAPTAYAESIIDRVDPADEEPRALAEMVDWLGRSARELRVILADSVFSTRETLAFSTLPSVPDGKVKEPSDRLADLAGRLQSQALRIHYFDASPRGMRAGEPAPVVVKTVVPGLEGETLSYHRLGERGARRLLDEGSRLVNRGTPRADDQRVPLTNAAESRLGGPVHFSPGEADAIIGDLYPLYREPGSHAAQLHAMLEMQDG